MSTTLTSRPVQPSGPPDLTEFISKIGVKVLITEDRSVDPAMLTIVQEAVWPYPEEVLLVKRLDDDLTIYDVMKLIDRLGFPLDYEDIR